MATKDLGTWNVDANWNWQSFGEFGLSNSPQALALETTFQVDANGDGAIGNVQTAVDAAGNTRLLKDGLQHLFVEVNGTQTALTYGGVPLYDGIFPGWQLLAAETINGTNQLLWQNTVTKDLGIWNVDANWNWQSFGATVAINSPQALDLETIFKID